MDLYIIIDRQQSAYLQLLWAGRRWKMWCLSVLILLLSCNDSPLLGLPYLHSQQDGKVNNLIPAASATWRCEDPSAMLPQRRQTREGNGNLPKWCESVASPPLTLEEPLDGAITSSFAFPRVPLTWSLGCVCEAVRGSGKREEKCTPRHGASRSRNGEQPERGRESGRGQRGVEIYSWLWAPVRVPAILSAHALQGLTVAGQKHRGRPGRAAGPLVSATCREPAGGIKRD